MKYRKPNGQIVEVNDHRPNIEHAERLGWIKAEAESAPAKPKRSKKAQP